jgi:hypothetical protein
MVIFYRELTCWFFRVLLPLLLLVTRNSEVPRTNSVTSIYSCGTDMDLQWTHHVIVIQPVYWRVGRIYRKHSFLYCCVLDRVHKAVACQRVDQIRYNTNLFLWSRKHGYIHPLSHTSLWLSAWLSTGTIFPFYLSPWQHKFFPVAFSPQANYTDRATAACRRSSANVCG